MIVMRNEIMDGSITEFVMEGAVDVEGMISTFESEYGTVSRNVLWDVSAGDLSCLTSEKMSRIAAAAKQYSVHEKTAFVGESTFLFGTMRMYEAHSEMAGVPLTMKVFRDKSEAIEWLLK
ncbi:MAG: hypothetical protein ACYTFY_18380 [Planctomycetota bacterium]|jgi:hypothetical protein